MGPGLLGAEALKRQVVLGRREVSAGVYLLTFRGDPVFLPGQNVSLTVEHSLPSRSYSLASAPGDPRMEVLFDLVPQGLLTPRLAALEAGDSLFVSPAFGGFLDDERPATWIAAGTGVAPFASMVRSGLVRDKILVHASRSPDGLYFRELFTTRLGLRYIPCVGVLPPGSGRAPCRPSAATSCAGARRWCWRCGTCSWPGACRSRISSRRSISK